MPIDLPPRNPERRPLPPLSNGVENKLVPNSQNLNFTLSSALGPQERFPAKTTYTGTGVGPENQERPPRIARLHDRRVGLTAMNGLISGLPPLGPGFLETVSERIRHERTVEDAITTPIDIAQSVIMPSNAEIEQAHLVELFRPVDPKSTDSYGISLEQRARVTEESLADAHSAFLSSSSDVREVIKKYRTGDMWREERVAELVRTNLELRLELGTHLLQKFEDVKYLPQRVMYNSDNNLKNPNFPGYGRMTSREYSTLLALAMLDGTFNASRAKSDPIETEYGEVLRGQHRAAAQKVLNTDVDRSY